MLSSAAARNRFSAWPSASRILVYDADSTAIGDSSNINGLLRKFMLDGFHGELAWLKGGFHAVWRDRRDIVDALPPTPENDADDDDDSHDKSAQPVVLRTRHLPMAAFSLSSTTVHNSPFFNPAAAASSNSTAQSRRPPAVIPRAISSPTVSHPAFNPFFDTIRQNTELSQGITERIPLRLPRRVRRRIHELPFRWLQDIASRAAKAPAANASTSDTSSSESEDESDGASIANIEEGKEALAMQFFKIELSEQRRLMGIMEHHSKESGQVIDHATRSAIPFPFSITAGVEKGAKNRYRHIWPFEHARVRLHQKREADDDYINASYIQPLGTNRRYIATQGPLPATFTDFWTLCWEQNVHVIVMLTREVEGAMVKCGAYWNDTVFGPLRLRLISTEGLPLPDERPVSAGFFGQQLSSLSSRPPAKKIPHSAGSRRRYRHHHYHNKRSETIKRIFELTHTGHPEAEPRRVIHFQYLEWPDMNVPEDPRGVLGLIKQVEDAVKETRADECTVECNPRKAGDPISITAMDERTGIAKHALGKSPVLLHCSAGVGRTGGFIAVDAVLDAIRREIRQEHEDKRRAAQAMDVDQQGTEIASVSKPDSLPIATDAGYFPSQPITSESELNVHVPATTPVLVDGQSESAQTTMELSSSFPCGTSQWAENVCDETGISGPNPSDKMSSSSSSTPRSTSRDASTETRPSQGSYYYNSSSSLGTSVSGASSSSHKANFPYSSREPLSTSNLLQSVLSTELEADHRIRTISAPSGRVRSLTNAPTQPSARNIYLPRFVLHREDTVTMPSSLCHGSSAQSLRRSGMSSEGESPSRSASPSADEASNFMRASTTMQASSSSPTSSRRLAPTTSDLSSDEPQTKMFDYKEPRPLHEVFTPPPLTSFDEPIWEIVQDMREQRMSLCQSLRQYVFVHAAIIEGALMVLDEENEIADGLKPRQPSPHERATGHPRLSHLDTSSNAQRQVPHFRSNESVTSSSSTGKRPSTPTELPKKDMAGEMILSKRPSVKRKNRSRDGLTHSAEEMKYNPVALRAPSARSMPP
ncbi:hypothetical protein BDN70DRAFT_835525 [Pholiota conissans]|uniref:Uncharacterized protein n=1 Tax=Pholiota conissans TaxID=109636 RepID=A0A9P5Z1S6_9AGAR|nr:hypothetical protein BDN70DRAFT_835525 [Pholiota conissans]